jgi:hypothetical protein
LTVSESLGLSWGYAASGLVKFLSAKSYFHSREIARGSSPRKKFLLLFLN